MTKFYQGDKVQSKLKPGRTAEVVSCDNATLYLRLLGDEAGRIGSGPQGTWTARPENYELLQEPYLMPRSKAQAPSVDAQEAPQSTQAVNPDWSYGEAERLHTALLKAAAEYNAYIEAKPEVHYYPASALDLTRVG
nr:MAG: hypothetical protein [Bacteriophage sp.]